MYPVNTLQFFLGGADLEMSTIRTLLLKYAASQVVDYNLSWGAATSAYQSEIQSSLEQGLTPVLIELTDDIGLPPESIVVVDHHGDRAGKGCPTSLHQVFNLLQLNADQWTRWFDLVAANDAGHIAAMLSLDATRDEIVAIREADRATQGITPAAEEQGEWAVAGSMAMAEGQLTLVHLPHARTATVTDRLHVELGGPGYDNLLVLSPDEVNFYGAGYIIMALYETLPKSWYGGSLPERGFWGHAAPVPDVLPLVLQYLGASGSPLFDQLTAYPTLLQAFDRVEDNQGGPGLDGETVAEFSADLDQNLITLQRLVRTERYAPHALMRVYIDKDDGSQRPLSIPAVRDRVLQTAAALVLTPILDCEFEDVSYAYRAGRSVQQAVQRIIDLRNQGYRWVVDADIRRYFDEIPHDRLLKCLREHADEPILLALIQRWLTVEVEDNNTRFRLDKGVPQGSPLSPLLANLYLDHFDETMVTQGYKLVRFADDFVILCKNRPNAEAALELSEDVLSDLELDLHPDKTRITHFDHGFRYLGTQFLRSMAYRPQYEDKLPTHLKPTPVLAPKPSVREPIVTPVVQRMHPKPQAASLRFTETSLSTALQDALEELTPDAAKELWEDLCEAAEEADFPPPSEGHDPSLRSFYLMEQGAVLGKEDERFVVRKEGAILRKIPALKVDQILVFGNIQISTPVMQFCLREDIPVFLLSSRGRFYGVLESFATDKVLLHRDQFARLAEPDFTLQVARQFVRGKIINCRTLLMRASRRLSIKDQARAAVDELQRILERLDEADTVDTLRGFEGAAAARYFSVWPSMVGPEWQFSGRKRRPPPDPVNSLLSFGYTLLFYNTYALVRSHGLHPHVGFYHALRSGHPALISDLMEEFRAPIVDSTVLGLLHRRQLKPDDFAMPSSPGAPCMMTESARKTVTKAMEGAFNRLVTHPDAGGRCDNRRAIALQAHRLVTVIQERDQTYEPFLRR